MYSSSIKKKWRWSIRSRDLPHSSLARCKCSGETAVNAWGKIIVFIIKLMNTSPTKKKEREREILRSHLRPLAPKSCAMLTVLARLRWRSAENVWYWYPVILPSPYVKKIQWKENICLHVQTIDNSFNIKNKNYPKQYFQYKWSWCNSRNGVTWCNFFFLELFVTKMNITFKCMQLELLILFLSE